MRGIYYKTQGIIEKTVQNQICYWTCNQKHRSNYLIVKIINDQIYETCPQCAAHSVSIDQFLKKINNERKD